MVTGENDQPLRQKHLWIFDMTLKYKILALIISLLTAYAFGRYSAPVQPNVKLAETSKIDTQVKDDKVTKTHSVTIQTRDKDGEVKVVTTTDTSTADKEVESQITETKIKEQIQSVVRPRTNVSLLYTSDFSPQGTVRGLPMAGILVSREILGPFTLGVIGLASAEQRQFGVVLGLDF
jgi:hypothetical protein